jgi:hypothetical protein
VEGREGKGSACRDTGKYASDPVGHQPEALCRRRTAVAAAAASFPEIFVMLAILFVDGVMIGDAGTFDNLDNAACVANDSNSCPESCQETVKIRPGPVKLRRQGRRLFHHNQAETKDHEGAEHKEASSILSVVFVCYHCRVCLPVRES